MSTAPPSMSREEAAALLGLAAGAPVAEVQRAFLRAARRAHPDALPEADDVERRAAADRFDALVRARATLLVPEPARGAPGPSPAVPGAGSRRVAGRGLGDSLLVVALLAFLIVALVTIDTELRSHDLDPAASGSPAVVSGTP